MMGVVVTGLRKRYGSTVAVDGLSLEFPAGKLSGFLGPNGAGKTTTFGSCWASPAPTRGRPGSATCPSTTTSPAS